MKKSRSLKEKKERFAPKYQYENWQQLITTKNGTVGLKMILEKERLVLRTKSKECCQLQKKVYLCMKVTSLINKEDNFNIGKLNNLEKMGTISLTSKERAKYIV